MAGITLTQAEATLAEYQAAESAVLSSQEYSIASRSLKRADLREIRDGITYWNEMVQKLSMKSTGRSRAVGVCPE